MKRIHKAGLWMLGIVLSVGCSAPGAFLKRWRSEDIPAAGADNPVVKIICIWEPAEGPGLDGLPTRGLAGQILFFTAGEPTPVRADGDVRIYLYDHQGAQAQPGKPIHQFDYLGDAWTTHLRLGLLGPTYQVFVPYVRKHPYRAKCALRVRFQPKYGGPPVFSELVTVTLPGPTPPANRSTGANQRHLSRQVQSGPWSRTAVGRLQLPLGTSGPVGLLRSASQSLGSQQPKVPDQAQGFGKPVHKSSTSGFPEASPQKAAGEPEVEDLLNPGPVEFSGQGVSGRRFRLRPAKSVENRSE